MKASVVLPLLLLGIYGKVPPVVAQSPGAFTATGAMTTARWGHTATLLSNGKVLIAGGSTSASPNAGVVSAELYDPSTGTFSPTGNMIVTRRGHTATLLPDGKVLIASGDGGGSALGTAELYDPSTGSFTLIGNLNPGPGWRHAVLLANGKVLFAGGPKAELYDPATGVFASTGVYAEARLDSVDTATLLPDGRVLITGYCMTPELYDPVTGTFSLTGPLTGCDNVYTEATLLVNGKVLFVGNIESNYFPAAEMYDPANGTFTQLAGAPVAASSPATLLSDGTVLITGGVFIGGGGSAAAWLYDPATGKFASAGRMTIGRDGHSATLLPDGTILIAGGFGPRPPSVGLPTTEVPLLATAEIYTPPVLAPAPVLFSLSGDGRGQGAILHAGTARVVSASNPAAVGDALEIYCTSLIDGSVIPPQVTIGGRLAEVLSFGKVPGFAVRPPRSRSTSGVNQVNVRVPSGIAPGPAVPVRLMYLGRPSNEVTIGVR